ncbi:MAG: dihydrolipoamide acetyltransferase family protein [Acidimicrobiales bacterium]
MTAADTPVGNAPTSDSESHTFSLPSLGADMDQGTVLQWLVSPGDRVQRGDVVARVETDKSDIDVEIWQSGTITEVLLETGIQVPVGTPLLRLTGPDAGPAEAPQERPASSATAQSPTSPPMPGRPTPARTDRAGGIDSAPRSSPYARSLSQQLGVSLAKITGSGPGGAIIARDIPTASLAAPPKTDTKEPTPAQRMRNAIAERMSIANRDIPHYHLERQIDMTAALQWLEYHNEELDVAHRVVAASLLIKATATSAADVPALNGFWKQGAFHRSDNVNVAVAVSLRKGGLVTPVISMAEDLSIDQTMDALRDRVAGARSGTLRSSWMEGGTITVTNLGDNGADKVHGVIFPPQVALVGFGRIHQGPVVVEGLVAARPVVAVTLSADHRATDGATGSRFLNRLNHYLQNPEEL